MAKTWESGQLKPLDGQIGPSENWPKWSELMAPCSPVTLENEFGYSEETQKWLADYKMLLIENDNRLFYN